MSTDDRIGLAAGLLYQRLEVTPGGTWRDGGRDNYGSVVTDAPPHDDGYGGQLIGESMHPGTREYVVTMQPAVARALAGLLAACDGMVLPDAIAGCVSAIAKALLDASFGAMPADPRAHLDAAARPS